MYNLTVEKNVFVSSVIKNIKEKFPDIKYTNENDDGILFSDINISIGQLYNIYKSNIGIDPATNVNKFLEEVLSLFSIGGRVDLKQIMPTIHSLKYATDGNVDYYIKYVNNTCIIPVVNFGSYIMPISKNKLKSLSLDDDELLIRLMRINLIENVDYQLKPMATQDSKNKCVVLSTGDRFASSFLLIDGVYLELSRYLGKTFFVSIPNRSVFVGFNTRDEKLENKLNAFYVKDFGKITKSLFVMTADGVAGTVKREV